jgi:hypothetical protein
MSSRQLWWQVHLNSLPIPLELCYTLELSPLLSSWILILFLYAYSWTIPLSHFRVIVLHRVKGHVAKSECRGHRIGSRNLDGSTYIRQFRTPYPL